MKLIILIIFLNKGVNLIAQINPSNGSILNYNQILFEYPIIEKAEQYLIQIAEDNIDSNFENLIVEKKDNSTVTIISNLTFGKKYKWRYAGLLSGKYENWNGPYKFSIVIDSVVNVNNYRASVIKKNIENSSGVISLDYIKMVIDRNGLPVWYLPSNNNLISKNEVVRDLRITNSGTFTFITSTSAIECDINGNVLWSAPNDGKVSGDMTEYYHHGFKKITNGNYMVMGQKYVWKNIPNGFDITKFRKENLIENNGIYQLKILFGTIIEYNKEKEVVWSWNSADYFKEEDLFSVSTNTNSPRKDLPQNAELFGHLNAFEEDLVGEFVYAGFRDISRIVKINKKSGQVVYSWGEKMSSGEAIEGNGFFKHQHDISITPNNNLIVFNNNDYANASNTSSVVEFSQPSKSAKSEVKWNFDCKFDSLASGKSARNGGVEYISNNNVLICMGGVNRIIEVLKNKKVVWDCFIENKVNESKTWKPSTLYRTHYKSSLYPYYFSVQANVDKVVKSRVVFQFVIFNEGTNDDSYHVNLYSSSGIKLNNTQTSTIEVDQSKRMSITVDKIPSNEKEIILSITSINNPNLLKQIRFKLN